MKIKRVESLRVAGWRKKRQKLQRQAFLPAGIPGKPVPNSLNVVRPCEFFIRIYPQPVPLSGIPLRFEYYFRSCMAHRDFEHHK